MELPTQVLQDRVLVFASNLRSELNRPVIAIHRAAIYYLLHSHQYVLNREIALLAGKAARRMGKGDRVDFCDLFDPHSPLLVEFMATHHVALRKLWLNDIRIVSSGLIAP
jgi:hypothetical protein